MTALAFLLLALLLLDIAAHIRMKSIEDRLDELETTVSLAEEMIVDNDPLLNDPEFWNE